MNFYLSVNPPEGWEELPGVVLKSGRNQYVLHYRLDAINIEEQSHIGDIQLYSPSNGERPPFGYRSVFCPDSDAERDAPLWLCCTLLQCTAITGLSTRANVNPCHHRFHFEH